MHTVNRFVIKNYKTDKYYNGEYDWTPNIWEAKLYKNKPYNNKSLNTHIVMVSVEFKEYPYEITNNPIRKVL